MHTYKILNRGKEEEAEELQFVGAKLLSITMKLAVISANAGDGNIKY
jgi:hypothetical protein